MKATIWHNPRCGTSRKTLEILQADPNLELEVVEYLKNPPTPDELRRLYAEAGISARAGLRTKEAAAQAISEGADDEAILAAMAADPILIERPLVRTDKGVRLCRPQDKVREIL